MADNTDNRRAIWGVPEKLQLHIAMLTLQFGYAGFHVVSRAALNMGISKLVFPVYRNIIALLLLLPFAYFLEKKERPAITLNFLIQFFFLALIGITANQGFYLLGLDNTSPTFASSMQNSKVRLDRRDGISKVLGTALCVAGASVITLYKGPTIYTPTSNLHTHLLTTNSAASAVLAPLGDGAPKNWTLGCIYLIGHCLSWSGWLVFQAPVLKSYPARLSVTSYTLLFGIIQFVIIAAFFERDSQAWVFHSGWELFSFHHPLRRNSGVWNRVCGSDLVYRQRGSSVRCCLPACSDFGRCHYGFDCFRRRVLLGRYYWSCADYSGTLLCVVR
ncbi:unnamed protein product [Eruca vesicaria subsp. sativa]|uniref:WAT1-related protein n=1 Tax=Eruca vesicaria subsp. sativa TaxID=29727 RepID=A0ABC8LI54_ERUVS|nr:unnamed protein product [Eruca vesicaria subsp. sativa]